MIDATCPEAAGSGVIPNFVATKEIAAHWELHSFWYA
jgi:hypothetical protein